jgi:hypothetical protein
MRAQKEAHNNLSWNSITEDRESSIITVPNFWHAPINFDEKIIVV